MSISITLAHFCDIHGPKSVLCTSLFTNSLTSTDLYCDSCVLTTPSGPSILRTTINDKTYQTGQTHPLKYKKLTSLIRKALSEETLSFEIDSPPLMFKDEVRGLSIVKAFKIWDLEARGSWRRYCFLINEEDEGLILKNFDLIRDSLNVIISQLIEKNDKLRYKSFHDNNDLFLRGKVLRANGLTGSVGDDEIYVKIHLWAVRLLSRLYI